ncbi:MAG: restriction endonuclease subunit S [Methanobacteriaceae archaeon]|nr:restriction endonuclease subunit S [Methanobacteriaceae archaeon]
MTNENVPKLRFKEFTGEWETVKLGEISQITGGGTPSTDVQEYWDGTINWYTPSEIGEDKYVSDSNRKITKKGLDHSSAKLLPEYTILLPTRATIGEMSIITKESTTNQGFQSVIVNENSNFEFIYYLLSTLKKTLIKNASGSTFLEISGKEIKKLKIKLPSLKEQEKIANFLSKVDNKISMIKEQLTNREEFKKGLLQQMFV